MRTKAHCLPNEEQLRGLETAPVSGTGVSGAAGPNEHQLRGAGQTPASPSFVAPAPPLPALPSPEARPRFQGGRERRAAIHLSP